MPFSVCHLRTQHLTCWGLALLHYFVSGWSMQRQQPCLLSRAGQARDAVRCKQRILNESNLHPERKAHAISSPQCRILRPVTSPYSTFQGLGSCRRWLCAASQVYLSWPAVSDRSDSRLSPPIPFKALPRTGQASRAYTASAAATYAFHP